MTATARRITYSDTVSPDTRALALPLGDAKKHLRVTWDHEDDLITSLIVAATDWCETYQGRRYVQGLVTDHWTGFPCREMPLRWAPLPLSVEGVLNTVTVAYYDVNGVAQTLTRETHFLAVYHAVPPYIYPIPGGNGWPATETDRDDAVQVSYIAGSDAVPVSALHAIRLLVGHWFRNREAASERNINAVEFAVKALLGPRRLIPVA